MKKLMLIFLSFILIITPIFSKGEKEESSNLNIYSLMSDEFTTKVFAKFEQDSKINVNIKYIKDEEFPITLVNEKDNPSFDFVFGGSSVIYDQLLSYDVFHEYKTKSEIVGTYFNRTNAISEKWIPILINPLVIVVNNKFIEENSVSYPTSWMDLLYPIYQKQIILPNPITTNCGADLLCTLSHIYGENGLEKYETKIDENVVLYTDSVLHALTAVEKGYSAITVCPLSYTYKFTHYEGDINIVFPVEGTNYCKCGGAILKGSKNIESSEVLVDWIKSGGVKKALDEKYYTILLADDAEDNVIYNNNHKIKLISIDKSFDNSNIQGLIDRFESSIKTDKSRSFVN